MLLANFVGNNVNHEINMMILYIVAVMGIYLLLQSETASTIASGKKAPAGLRTTRIRAAC